MTRIRGITTIATLALLASGGPALAAPAERGFTLTDFDRIRLEGPYAVELVTGKGTRASATGDRAALDRIQMAVQGRTLTIRADRSGSTASAARASGPVTIRLSTSALQSASIIGSGSLKIDRVRALRLDLVVQGSGRMTLVRADIDRLKVGLMGSGALVAGGSARAANVVVRGSAAIDGSALAVNDLDLVTESAGDVALGARNSAKIRASGAGNVTITGKPACTVTATGSGAVSCG